MMPIVRMVDFCCISVLTLVVMHSPDSQSYAVVKNDFQRKGLDRCLVRKTWCEIDILYVYVIYPGKIR